MSKKRYSHIFFDFDRTIWDFEANASETLVEIHDIFQLDEYGIEKEKLVQLFTTTNNQLWKKYARDEITKENLRVRRFEHILSSYNVVDKKLCNEIGMFYVTQCPLKKHLVPNAREVLMYLKENHHLHIITNGFLETQWRKLENCRLISFFEEVIISEEIGFKKPSANIFKYALTKSKANAANSIMVGDDLDIDIEGAASVGMDQVFYNPLKISGNTTPTYEIHSLLELKQIL